ncbi:MAG: electron transfer flavoprotein subunit alpha/FixB family protein [Spirochaetes bacterium]|nr:electron transfer flavoprotein subunit alpha/FixB family protein [Spirochaetota bacterium]MBU1080815.1 electron transfer flavoprotein subunit alpha/FixB family protein [Spirochaetota bacterium]
MSAETCQCLVWTIAEQRDGALKDVSFELLARGRRLADKLGTGLASVVIGDGVSREAMTELVERGADAVYSVQDPRLAHFVCEPYSNALSGLVSAYSPSVVLAAATSSGRTLMPHLAVRVRAGLTADCTELDIEEGTGLLLQTRPAIGGNIMATIKTPDRRPQMATVRPRSSRPLPRDPARRGIIVDVPVADSVMDGRVRVLGYRKDADGSGCVEEAGIVVAGGKGLKKAENLALVRGLAEDLGGVVGASREAVDRGWIGYPHQIGLSGKTVSPRLYVGIGISGAIQHLAGIKTSEVIVSVNPDPDANLHKLADYAVVADAFLFVPELRRRLAARKMEADNHGE